MLTERAILRDALPHDRVLSGAKNMLQKYALGSLVKEVIVGEYERQVCEVELWSCKSLPDRVARLR